MQGTEKAKRLSIGILQVPRKGSSKMQNSFYTSHGQQRDNFSFGENATLLTAHSINAQASALNGMTQNHGKTMLPDAVDLHYYPVFGFGDPEESFLARLAAFSAAFHRMRKSLEIPKNPFRPIAIMGIGFAFGFSLCVQVQRNFSAHIEQQ
jgi:hypothetical protein